MSSRSAEWAWGWDAVAALSTAIAAGAAIVAGIFAFATWRHDQAMLRRMEESERRSQAELISIWCDPQVDGVASLGDPMNWTSSVAVMVENRSSSPILNVERRAVLDVRVAGKVARKDALPHSPTRVLPPGDTLGYPPKILHLHTGPDSPKIVEVSTKVVFTDARGQRWVKDFDDKLKPEVTLTGQRWWTTRTGWRMKFQRG